MFFFLPTVDAAYNVDDKTNKDAKACPRIANDVIFSISSRILKIKPIKFFH